MRYLAAVIAVGLAVLAASWSNGKAISKTIGGIVGQPEFVNNSRSAIFIGVGLAEAVPILVVVIGFLILSL